MKKALLLSMMTIFSTSVSGQTLERLRASDIIHIGYEDNYAPFSYLVDGKPVGYSQDIALEIVDYLKKNVPLPNLEVRYVPMDRSKRFDEVNAGKVDLYCSHIANTKKSADKIFFSINFFVANILLITSKDSGIEHYGTLANKTIAVTKGTAAERVLSKNKSRLKHKTHFSKNIVESIKLLNQGEVDAILTDDYMGLAGIGMVSENPNHWRLAGIPLDKKHYSCLIAKGDSAFKEYVDKALLDLMKSRRIDRVYNKWFNQPIPPRGINFEHQDMNKNLEALFASPNDTPL